MRDPAQAHRLICNWHVVALKMGRPAELNLHLVLGDKHTDVPIAPWKIWKILNEKGISE
jgi:hypothetical protein